MDHKQERRPGRGGALPKLGGNRLERFYQNADSPATREGASRCEPFHIIVRDCLCGSRVIVAVEPLVITRPVVEFCTADEALGYAEMLSDVEGWPVFDCREVAE